jgi:hypothetical protein
MALIKLLFKPGINRDTTNYASEGGWYECDKIRFRSGSPQKIGGWQKASPTAIIGVCRQLYNYAVSYGQQYVSLGTQTKVYMYQAGYYYDLTPILETFSTPNTDNAVQTTNTSTTVNMNLGVSHNLSDGQYVTISGVSGNIGGVPDAEINANHAVTVVDANTFSITVTTAATSTVASGGGTAIVVAAEIIPGNALNVLGYGFGAGPFGRDAYGLGAASDPVELPQTDWWFDNLDNDLFMNIRGGAPYVWVRGTDPDDSTALATRAITLQAYATAASYDPASVPVRVTQLLVSQQDQHLIAFGAVQYGSTDPDDFDPMLIRWADQANPGQWTPAVTNSSGFIRLSRGSAIVRALPTRQEILVWTNTTLYGLQYIGTPDDVFSVQQYAANISLMSARACTNASGTTYWMGADKFFVYNGQVETLPCTLRDHVFQNFNYAQSESVICGTNDEWGEVWWFYPSEGSDWNDSYVIYNYEENIWYYGTMARDSWLHSPALDIPIATGTTNSGATSYTYNQETGVDDDGAAMVAYIQSNDFDIGDGDRFMLTTRVIPDINFAGSTAIEPEATFTIRTRYFPGTAYQDDSSDSQRVIETSVDRYTGQVFVRARGRQGAIKVSSDTVGTNWQVGAPRIDIRPDGRR